MERLFRLAHWIAAPLVLAAGELSAQCVHSELRDESRYFAMDGERLVGVERTRFVYIYERVGLNWFLEAQLDPPIDGGPVDLSGDVLVLSDLRNNVRVYERIAGVWTETFSDGPVGFLPGGREVATDAGRVAYKQWDGATSTVHVIEKVAGVWTEALIEAPGGGGGFSFGQDLDLAGDTLFVADELAGVVHVYAFDGAAWPLIQTLSASTTGSGFAISLAASGSDLAVGAPYTAPGGAVVMFENVGGSWTEGQTLQPSSVATGTLFGLDVDLVGDHLVAAAPYMDAPGGEPMTGGAYVFERDAGLWNEVTPLVPSSVTAGSTLGMRVATNGELDAMSSEFFPVDIFVMAPSGSPCRSLSGSPHLLTAGGTIDLELDAGAALADRTYLILGSLSGDSPGFFVRGERIPLNPDGYLNLILRSANQFPFQQTLGTLDALGRASRFRTVFRSRD